MEMIHIKLFSCQPHITNNLELVMFKTNKSTIYAKESKLNILFAAGRHYIYLFLRLSRF